jgi:hypothetical protein
VATEELKAHLAAAIDALPQQEKVVLSLYYCEELTMREIGQVLEVTESRISQIHTTAMLHLRATLQNLTHEADAPAASPRAGCPSVVVASRPPSAVHPVSCNPNLAMAPACLPEGEPYGHALHD